MTTITITKNREGKIVGAGERDQKAYMRFRKKVETLEPGELFDIEVKFPRHGPFHRLHMKLVRTVFDHQDQFDDFEILRAWVTVGAGHALHVPGPAGDVVSMARSISYDDMDDEDFREHHQKVKDFLRSLHATQFLWPHLPDWQAADMVETILAGFEREQS